MLRALTAVDGCSYLNVYDALAAQRDCFGFLFCGYGHCDSPFAVPACTVSFPCSAAGPSGRGSIRLTPQPGAALGEACRQRALRRAGRGRPSVRVRF